MDYKFVAGQGVNYRPVGKNEREFIVVRRMSDNDDVADPQYKIKSKLEDFERIVMEFDLSLFIEAPAKVARRTFLTRV